MPLVSAGDLASVAAFEHWAQALGGVGVEVATTLGALLAEHILARWPRRWPESGGLRIALDAVAAWLEAPDAGTAVAAARAGECGRRAIEGMPAAFPTPRVFGRAWCLARVVELVASMPSAGPSTPGSMLRDVFSFGVLAGDFPDRFLGDVGPRFCERIVALPARYGGSEDLPAKPQALDDMDAWGPVLPAFVVGWEFAAVEGTGPRPRGLPPLVTLVEHQARGHLGASTLLGVVVGLEANLLRLPGAHSLIGLHAMGDGPCRRFRRHFPDLHDVTGTQGGAYSLADLAVFDRVFGDLGLPSWDWGVEGLIRAGPCDPLDHLGSWRVRPPGRVEAPEGWRQVVDRAACLDEGLYEELLQAGLAWGQRRPPRLFLAWETADD